MTFITVLSPPALPWSFHVVHERVLVQHIAWIMMLIIMLWKNVTDFVNCIHILYVCRFVTHNYVWLLFGFVNV